MAQLTVIRGLNAGKRFELKKGTNTIGRNPDCDIVFAVSAVSREHAKIEWRDNRFFIEDLRSRNDTFVNDNKIEPNRPTPLGPGDRIKICDYLCEFSDDRADNFQQRANEDTGTVISSLQAASSNVLASQPAERLRILLEISNNMARNVEMNRLLPSILDGLFQIYRQADRAFVIVKEEATDRFVPLAIKTRRERDESAARFSRTILNQCLEEQQALLIEDTAQNEQMQLAASISGLKVRSIMAAPMISPDGEVFGVIQVDTQDRGRKFNQDDLQLLIAVVNQAAVALNNVKLHDDLIQRQRTQREIEVAK